MNRCPLPRIAVAVALAALAAGLCLAQTAQAQAAKSQSAQGVPASIMKEVKNPKQIPAGQYTFVKSWQAETAGHNIGRLVQDPDAVGGTAWQVTPAKDSPESALYGPYIEVKPGDYMAFFRIKLLEPAEGDPVGTVDACVGYGQTVLASRDLTAADVTEGKYVEVPLGFRYDGGKLECRLQWPGYLGVNIDEVSLLRVEGANLSKLEGRAPAAVLSGKPNNLPYYTEPRPFPLVFPRSAPPQKVLTVCDLRKQRVDMRLLMLCLQGLVNRSQPRLYCLSVSTDPLWLERMQKERLITGTRSATPAELLKEYRDVYKGVIITDPLFPATMNVATMLASVDDALPASPRLAKTLGLPVIADLRGRWKTNVEAYRWAFDNLWPRLNHHVIACLWPDYLALRDYLVENKVFIFWISGPLDGARPYASPTAEAQLMEKLLAKMPVNIPVMGYPYAGKDVGMGEGPGVSLFAEFGKYLVGSIDESNLSVHSGFRLGRFHQKPAPPAPKLDPTKVYYSFIISDGDNLPVLTNGNFPQLWEQKQRGQFPIGWTMSPSASVLLPDVVEYYYRTATPDDYFLAAVSGVGYTYPDLYGDRYRDRQRVFDGFLEQTARYMKRCGETEDWIMNATKPSVIARYAEMIPFLQALFPDYGRRIMTPDQATYATARNVPVFHAVTTWQQNATREQRIEQMVSDIRNFTPAQKPAFLHAFAINWFTDLGILNEVRKRLGPEYVCVRPDHLAELWHEAMQKREVVIHIAPKAAYVEGSPLRLSGSLQDVTDHTLEITPHVVGGMRDATVKPGQVSLKSAQVQPVTITGAPTGEPLVLEVRGDFGTRRAEVRLQQIPRDELLSPLPRDVTLVPAGYLEAETMPHRAGEVVADATASDGKAWAATAGKTQAGGSEGGYIVYGPYQPLAAGRYVAVFRLKRTGPGSGLLATLDACVGGGTPETGERELRVSDLPEGQWRWVPVPFRHPGGQFETRVDWTGAASMDVDAIALWRLEAK